MKMLNWIFLFLLLSAMIAGCAPQEKEDLSIEEPSGISCGAEPVTNQLQGNCHMEGNNRVCELAKPL